MIFTNFRKRKKNSWIPYGILLTEVFEHFKVDFSGETKEKLIDDEYLTKATLGRMGLVLDHKSYSWDDNKVSKNED